MMGTEDQVKSSGMCVCVWVCGVGLVNHKIRPDTVVLGHDVQRAA